VDPALPEAGAALAGAVHDLVPDWEVWELEELMPGSAGLALSPPPGTPEELVDQSACPCPGYQR
jgi:hypothetical protein